MNLNGCTTWTLHCQMSILTADVSLYLFEFLEIQDVKNLLLSSKTFGYLYFSDKDLLKRIVWRKLVDYSCEVFPGLKLPLRCSDEQLFLSLSRLQHHFDKKGVHPLLYLESLCVSESHKDLFRLLCRNISCRKMLHEKHVDNLLLLCHSELLGIILCNWLVSSRSIYHAIYMTVKGHTKVIDQDERAGKVKILIDYFLMKYHFPSFNYSDKSYFYFILDVLMVYDPDLFMYLFEKKKKYNFTLEYHQLINRAISLDNIILLSRIHIEQIHDVDPKMITIEPRSIRDMIEKGEFKCLRYVLKYMLDKFINTPAYMLQICIGLQTLAEKGTCIKQGTLEVLFKYLNPENASLLRSKMWDIR